MPAEQAQGILTYLKTNPEAAKAAWSQAQAIMQSPGLANAFINMSVRHQQQQQRQQQQQQGSQDENTPAKT
jgi:hypothetical protein